MKAKLIIEDKEIEIEISEEEYKKLQPSEEKKTGYERVSKYDNFYYESSGATVEDGLEGHTELDDEYYDIAKKLIEQTDDNNMKGYVLSNTADACVQFRKKDKALRYYAEAVKNYEKSNSPEEIAENYKSAAELMIEFNSPNKARTLLKKSLVNAVKTKNEDLISEINMLLASVCE